MDLIKSSTQGFEQALVVEMESIQGLAGKVFPLVTTEGVKAPYIAYESSYGLHDKDLNGYMGSKVVDAELNIIASTYAEMKRLTTLAVSKLMSFQSRSIGSDGPHINELTYMKPVELFENLPKLYRCVIEFKVHI